VFFSPAPVGWESGPAGSGAAGPGPGARVVPVPAAYSAGSVRLSVRVSESLCKGVIEISVSAGHTG